MIQRTVLSGPNGALVAGLHFGTFLVGVQFKRSPELLHIQLALGPLLVSLGLKL